MFFVMINDLCECATLCARLKTLQSNSDRLDPTDLLQLPTLWCIYIIFPLVTRVVVENEVIIVRGGRCITIFIHLIDGTLYDECLVKASATHTHIAVQSQQLKSVGTWSHISQRGNPWISVSAADSFSRSSSADSWSLSLFVLYRFMTRSAS